MEKKETPKKKKRKPKPPRFEKPKGRGKTLAEKYYIALWKWLKVIFWHYDDLKNRVDKLEKTIMLIRKELDELKKRLNGNGRKK